MLNPLNTNEKSTKRNVCNEYDLNTMSLLLSDYNVTLEDLGDLFGISRQAIDNKFKKGRQPRVDIYKNTWIADAFSDELLEVFEGMIAQHHTKLINDDFIAQISANYITGEFVLIYRSFKNGTSPRCLLNTSIPVEVEGMLRGRNYHFLTKNELSKIRTYITAGSKELLSNYTQIERIYFNMTQKGYPCNFEFFLEQTGLPVDLKTMKENQLSHIIPDEEIKALLQTFYLKEFDCVKIPVHNQNYYRIVNLAAHRGFTIKTFIEHYGFKYKRFNYKLRLKETRTNLLRKYIVSGDDIYISPDDKTYELLMYISKKKNLTMGDFIKKEFFYNLIIDASKLPVNYKPFFWTEYNPELIREDDFKCYINDFLLVKKNKTEVYFEVYSYFDNMLHNFASKSKTTADELLKQWGYNRTWENPELSKKATKPRVPSAKKIDNIEFDNDSYYLKALTDLTKEQNATNDTQARQTLFNLSAKIIVKLYGEKCQFCNGRAIPDIVLESGKKLIHLHNIGNGEDFFEGTFHKDFFVNNYVLTCNFHHNYLKHHLGGYKELDEMADGLYLINDSSEIKILTNKHLNYI